MTADEHLKRMMGELLAHYILEIAILRAETDRLRAELTRATNNGGAPAGAGAEVRPT